MKLVKNKTSAESPDEPLAVGRWYWIDAKRHGKTLCCITHIGSNYAELTSVDGSSWRVHFDKFLETCAPEPNADRIISERIEKHRSKALKLMARVQEITASLAIAPRQRIGEGNETEALAVRTGGQDARQYKRALIKAKDKTLPKLFEEIKSENKRMAEWMQAPMLAMEAGLKVLKPAIAAIKTRIFNVEIYAGLVETVEQIADGPPASLVEPLHVFQRRAYMDEECLAEYRTGGMEFDNLPEFDRWMAEPENRDRLLPRPRSVVAFRVRRNTKQREAESLRHYINIKFSGVEEDDKLTFLYIRNGDQLFRLNTEIEFGERLFPDLDHSVLDGTVYAKMFADRVEGVISEHEYKAMVASDEEKKRRYARECEEAERAGKETFWVTRPHLEIDYNHFEKWTPDSVYYDDIERFIRGEMDRHNRVVLLLQGLLDRSPVFQPHPPWQLWDAAGFGQAIRLIYDDSRALVEVDMPDFEAYRARVNASIQPGSLTVGQDDCWARREAARENARVLRSWRESKHYFERTHFRPYGNPGPGMIAEVKEVSKKGDCTFEWERERLSSRYWFDPHGPIKVKLKVPSSALLHVNGYRPGDFRQFFADPRTRADYLQWAPLMLEAEEWHAGNRSGKGKRKRKR